MHLFADSRGGIANGRRTTGESEEYSPSSAGRDAFAVLQPMGWVLELMRAAIVKTDDEQLLAEFQQ